MVSVAGEAKTVAHPFEGLAGVAEMVAFMVSHTSRGCRNTAGPTYGGELPQNPSLSHSRSTLYIGQSLWHSHGPQPGSTHKPLHHKLDRWHTGGSEVETRLTPFQQSGDGPPLQLDWLQKLSLKGASETT
ncbi:hypothetical protein GN956_G24112 [Arapaima gigas]